MLWLADQSGSPNAPREHVIPTGEMHLVLRLSDHPLRLFDDDADAVGRIVGTSIVAGPRSTFHVKDVSMPVQSVGVQIYPWAAEPLFGAPPDELAGRHLTLDDLWGGAAQPLRERLQEARGPEARLALLDDVLAERLARVPRVHPAAAEAIERFRTTSSVHEVVRASGYSHRALVAIFRRAVGITPKRYAGSAGSSACCAGLRPAVMCRGPISRWRPATATSRISPGSSGSSPASRLRRT